MYARTKALFVAFSSAMCRPKSKGSLTSFKSSTACQTPLVKTYDVCRTRRPKASYFYPTRRKLDDGPATVITLVSRFCASQLYNRR